MEMFRKGFIVVILLVSISLIAAQEKISREQYIELYAKLAMNEMARTGIPASITLAQGCLESDNGNSRLAKDAKNHFGIKCHDWTGRKIHHDDDKKNECFRKYKSVNESYIDHSEFLTSKSRYAALFELKGDDYKAWASGLQKAGYATSKKYASMLIGIIEENNLSRYDQIVLKRGLDTEKRSSATSQSGHKISKNNGIEFIVSQAGDSPDALREELDLYPGEIYRYNDIRRGSQLDSGMIIYIQPKRMKAEKGKDFHVVVENETIWDISQLYGVKIRRLYRMNNIPVGDDVAPGTTIWLRKRKPDSSGHSLKEEDKSPKKEQVMELEFDDF